MMPTVCRPSISDLSQEGIKAALNARPLPDELREQRHPQLAAMRQRAKAAVADLQAKGILNSEGTLISQELPFDMRPESESEC